MQTTKIRVFFDVRRYNEKLTREQRQLLADNENITASASWSMNELPPMFFNDGKADVFVRAIANKAERDLAKTENRQPIANAYAVKFKIGANCRWFNDQAQPMQRPTNAELEEGKWNAVIDFARRDADPNNPKKACGYWVNAIMLERVNENPFSAFQPMTTTPTPTAPSAPTTPTPTPTPSAAPTATADDELPF